jgi:hypothetical protein
MAFRVAIAVVVVLLMGGASPSYAAACDPGTTQADIDACTPEVHAHCGEFIPDRDAITRCLLAKIRIISAACRAVMKRPPSRLRPCRVPGNN